MKPRIGFDARYINDRYHGIGRYAFELLKALVRLTPDYEYVLFSGKYPDSRFDWMNQFRKENIKIVPGPWPLYWPQEQLLWPRLLAHHNIDLFHSPYFPVSIFSRLPQLNTIHDLIFDFYPQYMPESLFHRLYYRLLMKLSLQKVQTVLAVSQATARDVHNLYNIPQYKLLCTGEGVDEAFRPQNGVIGKETLSRYGIREPYILTIGVRRPHKNLDLLVRAFHQIHDATTASLVFAGPGDTRFPDSARDLVSSLNLQKRVIFLDWVQEADLPALYAQAQMVALPSRVEGFGLPALESMASGVPVVAASNHAFQEVVGDAGILVPADQPGLWASAMLSLLFHPEKHRHFVECGLNRAKIYTWEKAARMVKTEYDRILES
jgi:glycosyltransferase involved in cell wall biosynthesis